MASYINPNNGEVTSFPTPVSERLDAPRLSGQAYVTEWNRLNKLEREAGKRVLAARLANDPDAREAAQAEIDALIAQKVAL